MKIGDLVKMKYEMWWKIRNSPGKSRVNGYTSDVGIVLERAHNAVKVMLPSGHVKRDLVEHWEIVSESR